MRKSLGGPGDNLPWLAAYKKYLFMRKTRCTRTKWTWGRRGARNGGTARTVVTVGRTYRIAESIDEERRRGPLPGKISDNVEGLAFDHMAVTDGLGHELFLLRKSIGE
jgi:hypothetical protein